jgi:hypothetical protein
MAGNVTAGLALRACLPVLGECGSERRQYDAQRDEQNEALLFPAIPFHESNKPPSPIFQPLEPERIVKKTDKRIYRREHGLG